MPTAQVGISVSGAGVSISKSSLIETDGADGREVTLPVAHAVASWVKTDADTAAGELTAGHGQTDGTYDVYWDGGERLGVAVVFTDDAIALEGGAGTDFPASATTSVVICEQVAIAMAIDGDEAELVAICLEYSDPAAESLGNLDFQSAAPASVETVDLVANVAQLWLGSIAQTKFTGNPITTVLASHNNTTLEGTLKLIAMQDSTP
jgi:hypothetical protein